MCIRDRVGGGGEGGVGGGGGGGGERNEKEKEREKNDYQSSHRQRGSKTNHWKIKKQNMFECLAPLNSIHSSNIGLGILSVPISLLNLFSLEWFFIHFLFIKLSDLFIATNELIFRNEQIRFLFL